MSDKIVKLQPIPPHTTISTIRSIFKDFKVSSVSIKGDAAYVKFQEFGQNEIQILDINFFNRTYNEQGWNAVLSVLPVSDWESSQEEVIETEKRGEEIGSGNGGHEYEDAEEIKTSRVSEDKEKEKEAEAISVPEDLLGDDPGISAKQVSVSSEKYQPQTTPNPYLSFSQFLDSTLNTNEIAPETIPQTIPQPVPEAKQLPKSAYVKLQQPTPSVLPSGVKQEVEQIISQTKSQIASQLASSTGQSIPVWVWPLALTFTLLSLTMH